VAGLRDGLQAARSEAQRLEAELAASEQRCADLQDLHGAFRRVRSGSICCRPAVPAECGAPLSFAACSRAVAIRQAGAGVEWVWGQQCAAACLLQVEAVKQAEQQAERQEEQQRHERQLGALRQELQVAHQAARLEAGELQGQVDGLRGELAALQARLEECQGGLRLQEVKVGS
jgi:hypothetical protein